MKIRRRPVADGSAFTTAPEMVGRLYAARGAKPGEHDYSLSRALSPERMRGVADAAEILAEAIESKLGIVFAGDFDVDGAVSVTVGMQGLRALGATDVHYVVPDRFTMGYGLSPALADLAAETGAKVLVTVDNGISAIAGVDRARALGFICIVTDHHLPGPTLPAAHAIVNPQQVGCEFESRNLAGVGVMFYTLIATRSELRKRGYFRDRPEPNLSALLDLVALGTVADVVKLDYNNRILVEQGLRRIRAGRSRPGIEALIRASGVDLARMSSQDCGFRLGPRINAAGRLDDIRTGIECLLAPTIEIALPFASALDDLNRARRGIESDMRESALALSEGSDDPGIVLYSDEFHEGVVGLCASRLKDHHYRPAIVFARAQNGDLKGSGRSIPGFHIRDAVAEVDALHPGLILKFGGHAMAMGLTIGPDSLDAFRAAFHDVCRRHLTPDDLERVIETDGELTEDELSLDTARQIEAAGPWGQSFPEPLFEGDFRIESSRTIGEAGNHARYTVKVGNRSLPAVHFGGGEKLLPAGARLPCLYRVAINRWNNRESLDLQISELL